MEKQAILHAVHGLFGPTQCIDIGTSIGLEYTVLAVSLHEVTDYMMWS